MVTQTPIASGTESGTGKIVSNSQQRRAKSREQTRQQTPSFFSREGAQRTWTKTSKSLQRSTRPLRQSMNRIHRDANKKIRKTPLRIVLAGAGVGFLFGVLLGGLWNFKTSRAR